MAKFDFVEAAASGYRYVWNERRALLPLTFMPLAVKIGSYAVIALLGLHYNYLRQGLVMLPAFLIEGFIVALVIRMAVFGERYNNLYELGTEKAPLASTTRRAILASVVTYLLIKLILAFLGGTAMAAQEIEKSGALPEPNGSPMVTAILILVFMLWAFRFLWLYVPVAMGISAADFLRMIKPYVSSVYILGMWMLCFVPFSLALLVMTKAGLIIFPPIDGVPSQPYLLVMSVVNSVIELGLALTSSIAMAYAVRMIASGEKPPNRFL
jgi:hypothetical protein